MGNGTTDDDIGDGRLVRRGDVLGAHHVVIIRPGEVRDITFSVAEWE